VYRVKRDGEMEKLKRLVKRALGDSDREKELTKRIGDEEESINSFFFQVLCFERVERV
jgi:hypothetical protein